MDAITELPVREAKVAGKLAERSLNELLTVAKAYPASYDRERLTMEADVILDSALEEAGRICSRFPDLETKDQLSLFDDSRFGLLERLKGERADRRRKRKRS
jgi:hypothetical protein